MRLPLPAWHCLHVACASQLFAFLSTSVRMLCGSLELKPACVCCSTSLASLGSVSAPLHKTVVSTLKSLRSLALLVCLSVCRVLSVCAMGGASRQTPRICCAGTLGDSDGGRGGEDEADEAEVKTRGRCTWQRREWGQKSIRAASVGTAAERAREGVRRVDAFASLGGPIFLSSVSFEGSCVCTCTCLCFLPQKKRKGRTVPAHLNHMARCCTEQNTENSDSVSGCRK